jgi:hypothetical protein
VDSNQDPSDVVDTYNGTWGTASLSEGRNFLAATSVGELALFAGGSSSVAGGLLATVDIFDAETSSWTVAQLSVARDRLAAATVGNHAIFAGGNVSSEDAVAVVDAFDVSTGTWSTGQLSHPRHHLTGVAHDGMAFFAGGDDHWGTGHSDVVDISIELALTDCNENGVSDEDDIASGTSQDCDNDVVPDECQIADDPTLDQNGNGVLDACECVAANYCLAAGNSTGAPASMGWQGSLSIAQNNLELLATDCVPLQFGMFFYAREKGFAFFGEGALCVKSPVFRLKPIVRSDNSGASRLVLDFTRPPMSAGPGRTNPFSTWNFQYWYRDPHGGPRGFNVSDGLELVFCP